MKKKLLLLCIICISGCSVKDNEYLVESNCESTFATETRSIFENESFTGDFNFNVSFREAKIVAERYSSGKVLKKIVPYSHGEDTLFYVADYDNGYKVISGDKRTSPFLLESDQGDFCFEQNVGPAIWLNDFAREIMLLKAGKAKVMDYSSARFWLTIPSNEDSLNMIHNSITNTVDSIDFEDTNHYWTLVLLSENSYSYNEEITPHLLTTKWGQGSPWNRFVPLRSPDSEDIHCPTGCSAVALAQIVYYSHYNLAKPNWLYHGAQMSGTLGDPNDPIVFSPGEFFANSNRWDEMANIGSENETGVSTDYVGHLMADVGHQLGMSYGPTRSEADLTVGDFTHYGIHCESGAYDKTVVMSNLRNGKPVVIGATDNSYLFGLINPGGHIWVIDGLSSYTTEHVSVCEWRRLSEVEYSNYPIYSDEEMLRIDPDVFSGKRTQSSTIYRQYFYKMNWGHDGSGDEVLYGVNSSDVWDHNNHLYQYGKNIWYDFR